MYKENASFGFLLVTYKRREKKLHNKDTQHNFFFFSFGYYYKADSYSVVETQLKEKEKKKNVMRSKSQNPPGNPKIQHPFLIEMKMDGQ
jgi:hypothetical protein